MSVRDTFKNSLRNPISKKELKNPISNPRFQKLNTKEGFDLPATAEQRSMHDQNPRSNPRACTIKTHDQNPFQFANRSPFRNYHSWTEEEQLLATCFLDSDLKLKVSSKAHCRPTIKPSSTIKTHDLPQLNRGGANASFFLGSDLPRLSQVKPIIEVSEFWEFWEWEWVVRVKVCFDLFWNVFFTYLVLE